MKKPFYTGKAKGWLTADGKALVRHGNPKAATLFIIPGKRLDAHLVDPIPNAHEFFDMPEKPAPVPVVEAPKKK
jgi:hypothetical protein